MKDSKDNKYDSFDEEINTTTTPYDSFFYDVMGRPEVRIDFCKHNLPDALTSIINYSTLRRVENTYVDHVLKKYASDVVLECDLLPPKGWDETQQPPQLRIVLLVEHQSTPDYFMPFRIFHYMFGKLNEELKDIRSISEKLTPIYPVIFYNGKPSPYPYTKSLFKCFNDFYKIMELVFSNDIDVIDVEQLDIDELKKQELIGLVSRAMALRNLKQEPIEYLSNLLLDLYLSQSGMPEKDDLAQAFLMFIANVTELKDLKAAIEQNTRLSKQTRKDFMTAAEFFTNEGHKEGHKAGHKEGRKEGRNEEKVAVVTNALSKGYETEAIADLTGLDIKFIEQLKADLER